MGIDGSGPSRAALVWALRRAARRGESVVLMHVVDDEWGQIGDEYARIEGADGARVLDAAANSPLALTSGCDLTTQLVHGSVAWSLAHGLVAGDLVVVGTHKTGYLRGRAIGTRSIAVASLSPCNVAVIPDIDLNSRRGIVIGIAEGDAWRDAVRVGADEASRLGQDLALLHAIPDRPIISSAQGRELLAAASELAAETALGINIRRRVSQRRPADALLDTSHAASLLVLGVSRRHTSRACYVGSVIHDVLLNINSPVFVARNYQQLTTISA
ncbi:MAG: universal stress protein [Homoserinimonas sp.]